jgi:putative oxidoreductase
VNIPLQSDVLGKLILRLTVGGLILCHGVSKLMNPSGALGYMTKILTDAGLPTWLGYFVFVGEVVAPIMIILGFFSRVGGLLVFINMVFAIALVHTSQIMTITKTGGWALELQAFYLFGGLAIFFLGSSRIAVKPDSDY